MTSLLWIGAVAVGLAVTVLGSKSAVSDATKLATGTRLPPFFVGMTLLALGTDLPEIANSIVASYTDNGDVNVGDSVGSTITQLTLVLGVLSFAGLTVTLGDRGSRLLKGQQATAWLTAAALLVIAVLVLDDHLGRLDALLLIAVWVAGSRFVYRTTRTDPQLSLDEPVSNRPLVVGQLLVAIIAIGAGATLAVSGIIELAEIWGFPPSSLRSSELRSARLCPRESSPTPRCGEARARLPSVTSSGRRSPMRRCRSRWARSSFQP